MPETKEYFMSMGVWGKVKEAERSGNTATKTNWKWVSSLEWQKRSLRLLSHWMLT